MTGLDFVEFKKTKTKIEDEKELDCVEEEENSDNDLDSEDKELIQGSMEKFSEAVQRVFEDHNKNRDDEEIKEKDEKEKSGYSIFPKIF